jgi:hypothetical protein
MRLTAALLKSRVVQSDTPVPSLQIAFPAKLAIGFLPGVFPEDRERMV